jgi:crotonobetainyl-CoA:carnitine CoA-transferase CaiB-like acyl-CoA transferase
VLHGYRIVELGIWVAGPAAGGLLADWGAEVIKVESPAGDPMRGLFSSLGISEPRVPPYELDNRGKRSVMYDLATDGGKASMHELLATADVFVTNLRLDALERLGLHPEALRERYPSLIYAAVTGYGMQGPDRDRAGYDIGAFWARSGLAHAHVPPDETPFALRSGVGDHITGITTAAGILAALLARVTSGHGYLVSTSLLRTGIYCLGWDIGIQLRFGKLQRTRPREASPAPLINCYTAGDGRGFWLLGLEQQRHWPPTLQALGRPELADDPRFRTAADRAAHGPELVALLDAAFADRSREEWEALFDTHGVWWAPINTIADVIADPQAIAAGAFVDMPAVEGEPVYKAVASPVDFSGYTQQPGLVETLGQSTDSVLRELRTN